MLAFFCVFIILILLIAVILLLNSNLNYKEKNNEFINKYEKISNLRKAEEELSEKIKESEKIFASKINDFENNINELQKKSQNLSLVRMRPFTPMRLATLNCRRQLRWL